MRYAFAGDRLISCEILKFIISKGYKPLALLVSSKDKNSHADDLIRISGLEEEFIFFGNNFKKEIYLKTLKDLNLDYIIGIHFPYIIPESILKLPKVGFINLHPAYLPFNKGWHTPSWAILDNTKYGATLHFMSKELDSGDIIHQKEVKLEIHETANSLYKKVLKKEKEVFLESFDNITSLNPKRIKQIGEGTSHQKRDLEQIREIFLEDTVLVKDLFNKIRALTTNSWNEAAFFIHEGKKYGVQIQIMELDEK